MEIRSRRFAKHHSGLHRRRYSRRKSYPRSKRQTYRNGIQSTNSRRICCRPHCSNNQDTSKEEIAAAFKKAAENELRGILGYTEDAIVSQDVIGDSRSSIFDATASMSLSKTFHKIISWYDNEWGYSNRLCDLLIIAAKVDGFLS